MMKHSQRNGKLSVKEKEEAVNVGRGRNFESQHDDFLTFQQEKVIMSCSINWRIYNLKFIKGFVNYARVVSMSLYKKQNHSNLSIHLLVNDVCVFESVARSTLHVSIFQENGDVICSRTNITENEIKPVPLRTPGALEAAIAKEFVRILGESLSSPVQLQVPSGQVWRVELFEDDRGLVWLKDGWEQFADDNRLEFGDFMTFEYEGNSKFSVVICDQTATEIEYPLGSHPSQKIRNERDIPVFLRNDETLRKEGETPRKRKRGSSECREWKEFPDDNGMFDKLENLQPEVYQRICELCKGGQHDSLQKVKAFKPEYPFFVIVMQPAYIDGTEDVNVPLPFALEYFLRKDGGYLYLQLGDDKCIKPWKMMLNMDNKNVNLVLGGVHLLKGVASENEIEPVRTRGAIAAVRDFKSKFPFCEVWLTAGHLNGKDKVKIWNISLNSTVVLPEYFTDKYFGDRQTMVDLRVGEISSRVRVQFYYSSDKLVYEFSKGWIEFVKKNSLQAGNACIFEISKSFTKGHAMELQTTIFK
ncbi:B3 domain-containing protein_Os12g40080-like [Rutidosis leptorrhynchoides]|uniref:B3 domain-containing protein_Os12g40080-like n=1 Tax=Rutidosis leptorrhynchoides TaxID=125765 RepID=UPI003A98F730